MIESWHSTVEFQLRQLEHFATKAQSRRRVAAWIEEYNHDRRHSSLAMRSPIARGSGELPGAPVGQLVIWSPWKRTMVTVREVSTPLSSWATVFDVDHRDEAVRRRVHRADGQNPRLALTPARSSWKAALPSSAKLACGKFICAMQLTLILPCGSSPVDS